MVAVWWCEKRLEVKCFVDNKPLLESIASTRPPVNSDLQDIVRYLKDKLSWKEVSSYNWLPSHHMIADFFTKDMKVSEYVWEVFRKGTWEHGYSTWNHVTKKGLEFSLSNQTFKETEGWFNPTILLEMSLNTLHLVTYIKVHKNSVQMYQNDSLCSGSIKLYLIIVRLVTILV